MIATRASGHSRAVVDTLYRQHGRFVWRVLRRLGVPAADVDDAVHETFMVVQRRIDGFEARGEITTWLYAICLRVASTRRRSERRRARLLAAVWPLFEKSAQTPSDDRAVLERIIERMPLDQRTVFVLSELEQLDGATIAALLQVPVGTVRSRLRLARVCFDREVTRLQAKDRARVSVVLASVFEAPEIKSVVAAKLVLVACVVVVVGLIVTPDEVAVLAAISAKARAPVFTRTRLTAAARAPSPSPSRAPSPSPSPRSIADDVRALMAAKSALDRNTPAAALVALAVVADGPLEDEREALAIRALLDLGRTREATERFRSFRAAHPTSVQLTSLEGLIDE